MSSDRLKYTKEKEQSVGLLFYSLYRNVLIEEDFLFGSQGQEISGTEKDVLLYGGIHCFDFHFQEG